MTNHRLVTLYHLLSEAGQNYFSSLIKASSHSNITVEDIRKLPISIPENDDEKESKKKKKDKDRDKDKDKDKDGDDNDNNGY